MSQRCENPGAFRYTWPGNDEAYICAEHLPQLKAVAGAIGLYVQIRPLPEEEQWQCEQMVENKDPK